MRTDLSYAVWLRPAPPAAQRFTELIDALSRRLGTPRFEPHLTLTGTSATGRADVVARAQRLAARLAPVPIRLVTAEQTDAYFRCLYLRAEPTPPLLAAHRLACAELRQPVEADYLPHLSLVYGTLATSVKEKIIDELDAGFPQHFLADRINVCAIAGAPADWRPIGPFFLSGPMDAR